MSSDQPPEQEHFSRSFGYSEVTPEERQARIRAVFAAVAPRYDRMNDLMSMGIHRLWKNRLVREIAPRPGEFLVDLAGGTGDVAARLVLSGATAVVIDPSEEMMAIGRDRHGHQVEFRSGSAEQIPCEENSVDGLVISFGIRNVTTMEQSLREIHRVLKPGGRFFCLECSRPALWLRPFYDLYSFHVIPRLGAWVADAPIAYNYLVESIRRFPNQQEFSAQIEQVGFTAVRYHNLSFGIAAIHHGIK